MDFADRVSHHPPTRVLPRLLRCMWRQAQASPLCPPTPMDGQIALVTGGSRGIGLETSRGLAARGAEVVSAARGQDAGERMMAALRVEYDRPAHFLPLDLADLATVPRTLDRLEILLAGRSLDVLIANAGLLPTRHARSAQGHEIAFAANVLGHYALIRGALERDLLAEGCRVVVVTGDIYIMARECSAGFVYRGALGGHQAYCRSKLGNLWYAHELARRHPSLRVHAVHPGVVASQLGGGNAWLARAIGRAFMLSPERGAQTSLFCATQPGLASGTYYHNVLGRVELSPADPASDARRASELWGLLERLGRERS
jgi:retinol dehydrogenase-12